MAIEYYDLFKKQKPTPSRDSCGLCDPEKSEDKTTRICTHCVQTLTKIQASEWERILNYSIKEKFPEWFINFWKKRTNYAKKETPTVEAARESTGMTQQQLADLLGISVRTIQRWEKSNRLANEKVLKVCA